ncbi:MAG: amidohydrolase family protein [Alphaproteobacteria bacterium]
MNDRPASSPGTSIKTLYRGGLVFDGEAEPQAGLGVLVDGTVVTSVALLAEYDGYDGKVIDTSGGTLCPGLIDCHVHLCFGAEPDPGTPLSELSDSAIVMNVLTRAQATLASGVTGLRDCGGKNFLELAVRDACNGHRVLGPTMRTTGPIICRVAQNGDHVGHMARGPDAVAAAVRAVVAAGADTVNIMATGAVPSQAADLGDANYSAAEIAAGLAECRRLDVPCASNAQTPEDIVNVAANGAASVELGTEITDDAAAAMIANGVFLVPTLLARQCAWDARQADGRDTSALTEFIARSQASLRLFYRAGGRIAIGTDCGAPHTPHGGNPRELALLVDAGMKPLDVMRSATSLGAQLAGLAGEGRIAQGTFADFLVVDGDPTCDIAMAADLANHRLVVKRGAPVSPGNPVGLAA